MKISEAFPSNYLRAADLGNNMPKVVISHVAMEELGDGHKPVVYFQNKEKGLVLNKTNSALISVAYGDDTEDWAGREIILYSTPVSFQGRMVDAIRVRLVPTAKPNRAPVSVRPGTGSGAGGHSEVNPPPHDESDIPF